MLSKVKSTANTASIPRNAHEAIFSVRMPKCIDEQWQARILFEWLTTQAWRYDSCEAQVVVVADR
jgi:hypothetical protein